MHPNLNFTSPVILPTHPLFTSKSENNGPVMITAKSPTPPMTAYVESRPQTPFTPIEDESPIEIDDEFDFSVSLALMILVIYMLLGSIIFHYTDNWNFFHSFYFVYISMSTIGFGDFVPQDPVSMIASSVYFLFGLALTTMCINVVQEKFSDTFHRAKIQLGAKMGLDVNEINEECPSIEEIEEKSIERDIGFYLKSENIGQSFRERRKKRSLVESQTDHIDEEICRFMSE